MAETVTMNRASVAKPISRRRSAKPVTVSASAQAQQLQPDLHRQARSEGAIQRQVDGFPLDQSRVASCDACGTSGGNRRAVRRTLVFIGPSPNGSGSALEEAVGHMDEVVGFFISRLSGFAAGAAVVIWPRVV